MDIAGFSYRRRKLFAETKRISELLQFDGFRLVDTLDHSWEGENVAEGSPKYTSALTPPSPVQIVHYINSSPVFIHNRRNRSRRPASEGGRRILLDNSRVYVRFLPFVSGRVHLGRFNTY